MRFGKVLLTLSTAGALLAAQAGDHPYQRGFKKQIVGKKAVVMTGARAAIGEAFNAPKEWGRTWPGLGKRVASGFATHVVATAVEYPIAAARHEDLLYHRSNETRFGPRLRHALVSTVVTRKTTTGQKTVASGRITGTFAGSFVSRLWQPASTKTIGAGVASAGIALGADAGLNVLQEFWPRKKTVIAASKRR